MKVRNSNGKFKKSIEIFIGMKFGQLTVVDNSTKRDRSKTKYYLCECDCGIVKEVSRMALVSKDTRSCGCFNRSSKQKAAGVATWNMLFYASGRSALKRNISFNLGIDDFIKICQQNCAYCNAAPIAKYRYKDEKRKNRSLVLANGIDRVDSSQGYDIKNCTPCCSICNEMKMDRTVEEFLEHVRSIVKFKGIKNDI